MYRDLTAEKSKYNCIYVQMLVFLNSNVCFGDKYTGLNIEHFIIISCDYNYAICLF